MLAHILVYLDQTGKESKMKRSAFIIAGGDIRNKFHILDSANVSPALIPINSKVLAQYVLEAYAGFDYDNIFLIVNDDAKDLVSVELFETLRKCNANVIGVEKSTNVIETIKRALSKVDSLDEIITINLVTTIPQVDVKCNEILIEDIQKMNENWSGFKFLQDNFEIIKKGKTLPKECFAFQGVFAAESRKLEYSLNHTDSTDLIDLIHCLISNEWKPVFKKSNWIDCGHEENYFNAKNKLINSRSFNQLKIDESGILKQSTNKTKIQSEIDYYKNVPVALADYFPELISYGENEEIAFYEMSYFNFPDLSEVTLYWNFSSKDYNVIFNNLKNAINLFKQFKANFSQKEYNQFYFDKTINRLKQYKASITDIDLKLKLFDVEGVNINGKRCLTVDKLINQIATVFDSMYQKAHFSYVHGDLCFNNILVNPKDLSIKLIDPRGAFNDSNHTNFGDLAYDLAKLAHSSIYHYDYIVSDLFKVNFENESFQLSFNSRENESLLKDLTIELIDGQGYDLNEIKLIVAFLFLSMTPLHSDSSSRQLAMYLNGLKILNECFE